MGYLNKTGVGTLTKKQIVYHIDICSYVIQIQTLVCWEHLLTILRSKCLECLLQNQPSKGVPEVPEIPDGVGDASNWSYFVTLAILNPEQVESP